MNQGGYQLDFRSYDSSKNKTHAKNRTPALEWVSLKRPPLLNWFVIISSFEPFEWKFQFVWKTSKTISPKLFLEKGKPEEDKKWRRSDRWRWLLPSSYRNDAMIQCKAATDMRNVENLLRDISKNNWLNFWPSYRCIAFLDLHYFIHEKITQILCHQMMHSA